MSTDASAFQEAVLVLPRLRIQNANAISSPMTWGFPAMSAFLGLMHAIGRRMPKGTLEFLGIGVICHDFEAQVTEDIFPREFRLTRNPVDVGGDPAGIVEEGRIHLDLTLVFLVNLSEAHWSESARKALADHVRDVVETMRIAGGSVLARVLAEPRTLQPQLRILSAKPSERVTQFRRMMRRWLPGFALVARDDLLHSRLTTLQAFHADATVLDAWLDLSRMTHRATSVLPEGDGTGTGDESVRWVTESREGWIVPIPVGYAGISPLYPAGSVKNARDGTTPFRFVESAYSIGEWVSPHRMHDVADLVWYPRYDDERCLYRCSNDYAAPPAAGKIYF